jgi:hypothetical protein
MTDPDFALGPTALIVFVFGLLSSWTLHSRLRNRASRYCFGFLVAFLVWTPLAIAAHYLVLFKLATEATLYTIQDWFVIAEVIIPALLVIASSVCFWLAARTIGRPATNSA